MTWNRIAAVLVSGMLLACGGGGGGNDNPNGPQGPIIPNPCDSGASCQTLRVSLAAVNSGLVTHQMRDVRYGVLGHVAQATIASAWRADSIISGPPEEMRLYVKEILVQNGSGERISLWSSQEDRGTMLPLTEGTIDLGQALGATLSLAPGDYQGLQVILSRVAEFKGCVSGIFMSGRTLTDPTLITADSQLGIYQPKHVGNTYTNDPLPGDTSLTFCTKAEWSELAVPTFSEQHIAFNADFHGNTVPELVEVDLERSNDAGLSPAEIRAAQTTIWSPATFAAADNQETRVTLAVDLNRQLRYFANTRTDFNPPNPGMKTGTSYFFTTIFPDSVMLVAGDAGSIEGYALEIHHDATVNSGAIDLAEWITVIRDGDGNVAGGGVIPDDDNTLTIAKGGLNPQACVDNGGGTWDLGFGLGSSSTGALLGFQFKDAVGGAGSCGLQPLPHESLSVPASGYTVTYMRKL